MTLAISSNSPSITTDYTFKTNKTVTTEQNDRLNSLYEGYNREKSHIVDIWSSEAPSTLEEFKNCFARYDSLPIDWNKDFQEYMTSRGCKNESELKALNKSGHSNVQALRDSCIGFLAQVDNDMVSNDIECIAIRTLPLYDVSVEDLSNFYCAYTEAKTPSERVTATKQTLEQYIDEYNIEDFNLCLDSFLEILEKEEEEARNNELKKIEEAFDTVNEQSEKVSSNEKTFSVDTELQKINAQKAYAKV